MEPSDAEAIGRVAAYVKEVGLLENRLPLSPEYYYSALPFCVADAVFSIGVRYEGVRNAVGRAAKWLEWPLFREFGSRPGNGRTITMFLDRMGSVSPERWATDVYGNRQRTSSRNGILKAEATVLFARALKQSHIDDFEDVDDLDKTKAAAIAVEAIPGQHSGLSFGYFLMLAGADDRIKPDRMVCRFVKAALGVEHLTAESAGELLRAAAVKLGESTVGLTPRQLDYIVWNFQRRQSTSTRFRGH